VTRPPRRTSRTQEERSDRTRTLILNAAVQCLVARGYERTTTVTVQQCAGVSRGRLLHHYPTRTSLLIAAAHHLASTRIQEMEEWIARSPAGRTSGAERVDRATALLWGTFAEPYFWAAMELWTAARTDHRLRAELAQTERRLGRAIRNAIDTMYGPTLAAHPEFPRIRELLFTSMRGVALTYALENRDRNRDPHLPVWQRLAREALLGDGR
jgi:AcrR family transcriptional regulator